MRLRGLGSVALVFLLLALLGTRSIRAGEEPQSGGLDQAGIKRLGGKLRSRAAAWWRFRKPVPRSARSAREAAALVPPLVERHNATPARLAGRLKFNPECLAAQVNDEDLELAVQVFESGGYDYRDRE